MAISSLCAFFVIDWVEVCLELNKCGGLSRSSSNGHLDGHREGHVAGLKMTRFSWLDSCVLGLRCMWLCMGPHKSRHTNCFRTHCLGPPLVALQLVSWTGSQGSERSEEYLESPPKNIWGPKPGRLTELPASADIARARTTMSWSAWAREHSEKSTRQGTRRLRTAKPADVV